jgi:hypothetical protein
LVLASLLLFTSFRSTVNTMQSEQKAISEYLKGWSDAYVSGREIARKACGRARFEEDRDWATPILTQMALLGTLETDCFGGYRLKLDRKRKRPKTHISPQYMKILQSSGKNFESMVIDDNVDESALPKQIASPIPPLVPEGG